MKQQTSHTAIRINVRRYFSICILSYLFSVFSIFATKLRKIGGSTKEITLFFSLAAQMAFPKVEGHRFARQSMEE